MLECHMLKYPPSKLLCRIPNFYLMWHSTQKIACYILYIHSKVYLVENNAHYHKWTYNFGWLAVGLSSLFIILYYVYFIVRYWENDFFFSFSFLFPERYKRMRFWDIFQNVRKRVYEIQCQMFVNIFLTQSLLSQGVPTVFPIMSGCANRESSHTWNFAKDYWKQIFFSKLTNSETFKEFWNYLQPQRPYQSAPNWIPNKLG